MKRSEINRAVRASLSCDGFSDIEEHEPAEVRLVGE